MESLGYDPNAIRVHGGLLINPFTLTPAQALQVDYAHSLSMVNRFNGHSRYPYSVGQHVITLYYHVPEHLKKAALIHDNSEVFFNDIASPVKAKLTEYKVHEQRCMNAIAEAFEVSLADLNELKQYDHRLYKDESEHLHYKIDKLGRGDDQVALGVRKGWLEEKQWRSVRSQLRALYGLEFDDRGYWPWKYA